MTIILIIILKKNSENIRLIDCNFNIIFKLLGTRCIMNTIFTYNITNMKYYNLLLISYNNF